MRQKAYVSLVIKYFSGQTECKALIVFMLHRDIRLQTFSEFIETNCNEKIIEEKIKG